MVSFFALGKIFRILAESTVLIKLHCALAAPCRKVLWSRNLHHSAPLEMPFLMLSFFAGVNIFRFGPKTMDYSP